MIDTDLELKPHVIAFIDILGYSDMVFDAELTKKLLRAIEKIIEEAESTCKLLSYKDIKFKVNAFSDNIVIACEYVPEPEASEDNARNYICILMIILISSMIQMNYISKYGVLVRGGISSGNYFRNEKFVFGEGLVNAYKIENLAQNPRIVITDELVDLLVESSEKAEKRISDNNLGKYIQKDHDEKTFVHYLYAHLMLEKFINPSLETDGSESLERHYKSIEEIIERHKRKRNPQDKTNDSIERKIRWAIEYHNNTSTLGKGLFLFEKDVLLNRKSV